MTTPSPPTPPPRGEREMLRERERERELSILGDPVANSHGKNSAMTTPNHLAQLLSQSLIHEAESLRKQLAVAERRAAAAERVLSTITSPPPPGPNPAATHAGPHMPESAYRAIMNAEARLERAERAREETELRARAVLDAWAEADRYLSSLEQRAGDARVQFGRFVANTLAGITQVKESYGPNMMYQSSHPQLAATNQNVPAANAPIVASPLEPMNLPSVPPPMASGQRTPAVPAPSKHQRTQFPPALPPPPNPRGNIRPRAPSFDAPPPHRDMKRPKPDRRSDRAQYSPSPQLSPQISHHHHERAPSRERPPPSGSSTPFPHPSQFPPPPAAHPSGDGQLPSPPARHYSTPNQTSGQQPVYPQPRPRDHDRDTVMRDGDRDRERERLERERDQMREGQPSPTPSSASSLSLDEMILAATDSPRKKKARESFNSPAADASSPHASTHQFSTYQPPNGTTSGSGGRQEAPYRPRQNVFQPTFLPPSTGPPTKSSSHYSWGQPGGGGGRGQPTVNSQGQRTCRQCGMPGRYKDGKCVEKWGPGPEGPGTVCDRCRKKMKRVERRGVDPGGITPVGSFSQSQPQPQSQPMQTQPLQMQFHHHNPHANAGSPGTRATANGGGMSVFAATPQPVLGSSSTYRGVEDKDRAREDRYDRERERDRGKERTARERRYSTSPSTSPEPEADAEGDLDPSASTHSHMVTPPTPGPPTSAQRSTPPQSSASANGNAGREPPVPMAIQAAGRLTPEDAPGSPVSPPSMSRVITPPSPRREPEQPPPPQQPEDSVRWMKSEEVA